MSEIDDVRNSLADTLRKNYMITVLRWSGYRKRLAVMAQDCGVKVEITDERGGLFKKEVVFAVNGSEDKQSKFKFLVESSFEGCTRI
jgi:hypothetical protein